MSYKINKMMHFQQNLDAQADLSHVMRKMAFTYAKTKTLISFAVTGMLISAFVFAT